MSYVNTHLEHSTHQIKTQAITAWQGRIVLADQLSGEGNATASGICYSVICLIPANIINKKQLLIKYGSYQSIKIV